MTGPDQERAGSHPTADPQAPRGPWRTHRARAQVLAQVVKATQAAGPQQLAAAVGEAEAAGTLADSLAGWLAGAELDPVKRYLARATLRAPLAALGADVAVACAGPSAVVDPSAVV